MKGDIESGVPVPSFEQLLWVLLVSNLPKNSQFQPFLIQSVNDMNTGRSHVWLLAKRWFNRTMADPTCRYWIIVCDDKDVGIVNIFNLDRRQQRCYWAFYIAEQELRGKGVGSFVEYSVLKYVFDQLQLRKLCCEVLAFNEPVIEMHRKFGFQIEGRLRAHVMKGGNRPMSIA